MLTSVGAVVVGKGLYMMYLILQYDDIRDAQCGSMKELDQDDVL